MHHTANVYSTHKHRLLVFQLVFILKILRVELDLKSEPPRDLQQVFTQMPFLSQLTCQWTDYNYQ